jgi:hypothetical protein
MYSVAYKILLRDMQFFEDTTCQEDKQQDKLIKKRYGYSNTSFNWGEFNNIQELKFKMDEIYNKVRYKMLSLVSLQNENDDEIITERKLLKCFEEFGTNEYIDKYKYVLNMMEGVSFNKFYFLNHIEFISKPEYFDNLPLWLKVMYLYNIYHLLYKFKQEDDEFINQLSNDEPFKPFEELFKCIIVKKKNSSYNKYVVILNYLVI